MKRRHLLKMLAALGAGVLPFTFWPKRMISALENLSRPQVRLKLPPEPAVEAQLPEALGAQALQRTVIDDIKYLSDPSLQGRRAGTRGEEFASLYLQEQMAHLGLVPYGKNESTYVYPFTVLSYQEKVVNGRLTLRPIPGTYLKSQGANLIGAIPGQHPDAYVMLCAHYDHLGVYNQEVYPGANDNASGVGTILDVTRRLVREGKTPKATILIAFWSAEEVGFVGSRAFVNNPTVPLAKIKAVLNVDTVGNGRRGDFALWSVGENAAARAMQQAAAKHGVSLAIVPTNGHNSDHISFAWAGVPACTLLAREWLYKNHTPEDTLALINPDQIALAKEIVYEALMQLAF